MKNIQVYENYDPKRIRTRITKDVHDYSHYFEQTKEYLNMAKESLIVDKEVAEIKGPSSYDIVVKMIDITYELVDKLENGKLSGDENELVNKLHDTIELVHSIKKYNL